MLLSLWFPGQVKTEHWRLASSLVFLAGGAAAALLIFKLSGHQVLRITGAALVLLGAIWWAIMFQARSNCGDETKYIGESQNSLEASCQ